MDEPDVAPCYEELAAATTLAAVEPLVDVVDMDPPPPILRLSGPSTVGGGAASDTGYGSRRWVKQGALVNTLQGEFRTDLWSPGAPVVSICVGHASGVMPCRPPFLMLGLDAHPVFFLLTHLLT